MAARKRTVMQEPLLNTVARKLGHAAGTLTKVTQELADNVSAVPETVAAKVREAARATKIGELKIGGSKIGDSAESARGHKRHARKKLSRAVRPRRTRAGATGASTKQRSPRRKALRRKARASSPKK
jgi:hypothetical protein